MKCKPYREVTVEIWTQLKTVKITSNIFAVQMYISDIGLKYQKQILVQKNYTSVYLILTLCIIYFSKTMRFKVLSWSNSRPSQLLEQFWQQNAIWALPFLSLLGIYTANVYRGLQGLYEETGVQGFQIYGHCMLLAIPGILKL